jgi:uncharacterized protein (DUF1015 family)
MVDVVPFKGLRPPEGLAARIATLPYDVISREEASRSAAGNPMSFFHISRSEVDLPLSVPEHHPLVYEQAYENFKVFLDRGWLVQDGEASFYLYRQIAKSHIQTGIVAATSVGEYDRGIIKRHELTRSDKEEDRTRHISSIGANDEPVFLIYRADSQLNSIVAQASKSPAVYDFVAEDGIQHIFWRVPSHLTGSIHEIFKSIPCLYIADGHHRSAAASRLLKSEGLYQNEPAANYFLSVLFPHDQVKIIDYNRVVKDLAGLTADQFLQSLREKFDVEKTSQKKPSQQKHFGLYLEGTWYNLKAKAGTYPSTPIGALDVSILQANLLAPILGIQNPRVDKRISFVGGSRGAEELERLVDSKSYQLAFSLFPTTVEQLMEIADAGDVMPPKSTWFEPKLRSGLVVYALYDLRKG